MHILSFSLTHTLPHLTVSLSSSPSAFVCLSFIAYLCNTIKNFVKRIMHERAIARRAAQGRRGGWADKGLPAWPMAMAFCIGKRSREGGVASAYCAWSLHDFASNSLASLIIATHVVNTPFAHSPSMQQTVTDLWWKRKGRGNNMATWWKHVLSLPKCVLSLQWIRKVYPTVFCVSLQFIYVNQL